MLTPLNSIKSLVFGTVIALLTLAVLFPPFWVLQQSSPTQPVPRLAQVAQAEALATASPTDSQTVISPSTTTPLTPTLTPQPTQPVIPAVVAKPAERDPLWANATCNDGTPFAFVVRQALNTSNDWVIMLSAGDFCWDAESCQQRYQDDPDSTTTLPIPDGEVYPQPLEGLLSSNNIFNPLFGGANHVLAHDCSNDLWMGGFNNIQPSQTTFVPNVNWAFRGHVNLMAMLGLLKRDFGLTDSPNTRVLLVGAGNGTVGAVNWTVQLQGELQQSYEAGQIKLVLDGGWYNHYLLLSSLTGPLARTERLDTYWQAWRGIYHSVCSIDRSRNGLNPDVCFYNSINYEFIGFNLFSAAEATIPILVQQSLADPQLARYLGLDTQSTSDMAEWARTQRLSLQNIPWRFTSPLPYSTLTQTNATLLSPAGLSFYDVLVRFWTGGTPQAVTYTG